MRHDPRLARAAEASRDTVLVRAIRRSERMMMVCLVVMACLAALLVPGRALAALLWALVR